MCCATGLTVTIPSGSGRPDLRRSGWIRERDHIAIFRKLTIHIVCRDRIVLRDLAALCACGMGGRDVSHLIIKTYVISILRHFLSLEFVDFPFSQEYPIFRCMN